LHSGGNIFSGALKSNALSNLSHYFQVENALGLFAPEEGAFCAPYKHGWIEKKVRNK